MKGNIQHYKNSSQILGLIFFLTVVCTIFFGGLTILDWMKDPRHSSLSRLLITGNRYYTSTDDILKEVLSTESLGTFMTQNLSIIHKKIKCLPWIKYVSVRKQWPDELKIHVVEYVPIAGWNGKFLLDEDGKVFSIPIERLKNHFIPMLSGPEGTEKQVLHGYHLMNEILKNSKYELKELNMSANYSWSLILRDDTKLELGRNNSVSRLQRFIKIYPLLLQQADYNNKRIRYVDLRYDSGLAVGWDKKHISNLEDYSNG